MAAANFATPVQAAGVPMLAAASSDFASSAGGPFDAAAFGESFGERALPLPPQTSQQDKFPARLPDRDGTSAGAGKKRRRRQASVADVQTALASACLSKHWTMSSGPALMSASLLAGGSGGTCCICLEELPPGRHYCAPSCAN